MDHFHTRPGPDGPELWCEETLISAVAEAVGTPVYVYSAATLERHLDVFRAALPAGAWVAFAVKANGSLAVLRTLARRGAGADTVSEGEIRRALAAGVPAERIIFSGVGKTDAELAFAITAGVAEINVESEPELDRLHAVAEALGARPKIAFRVNPDVGAGGHAKITTGAADSKFGVSLSEAERLYARASVMAHVEPVGVACHIGSQISDLAPLEAAARTLRALVERLRAQGLAVRRMDLGGGLGAPYFNAPPPPSPAAFGAMVARVVDGLEVELAFEPGRVIAANAGVLLTRVIHVHERPEGRRYLVLDAGMNDLLRPAMYDAYHALEPVRAAAPTAERLRYDVVGPVCETGDTFARDMELAPLAAGDLAVFRTAGAYGAVMASEYNARPLVPEVLVKGDRWALTRPRPTYDEMLAREHIPDWA